MGRDSQSTSRLDAEYPPFPPSSKQRHSSSRRDFDEQQTLPLGYSSSSSSRPAPRSPVASVSDLLAKLDDLKDVLNHECSRSDDYGRLATALVEKELRGVDGLLTLLRPRRTRVERPPSTSSRRLPNDETFIGDDKSRPPTEERSEKTNTNRRPSTSQQQQQFGDLLGFDLDNIGGWSEFNGRSSSSHSRRGSSGSHGRGSDADSRRTTTGAQDRRGDETQRRKNTRSLAREGEDKKRARLPAEPTLFDTLATAELPLLSVPTSTSLNVATEPTRTKNEEQLLVKDVSSAVPIFKSNVQNAPQDFSLAGSRPSSPHTRMSIPAQPSSVLSDPARKDFEGMFIPPSASTSSSKHPPASSRGEAAYEEDVPDTNRRPSTSRRPTRSEPESPREARTLPRRANVGEAGERRRGARSSLPSRATDSESSITSEYTSGGGRRRRSRLCSEEARIALSLASAPPAEVPLPVRLPAVLDDPIVVFKLAEVLSKGADAPTLANLALVSRKLNSIVTPVLYHSITIATFAAAVALASTLESPSARHTQLVQRLKVLPLDIGTDGSSPVSDLIVPLKTILDKCTNLQSFEEDFTSQDWDVRDVANDYPLTGEATGALTTLTSHRCWWEIGAVYALLLAHRSIKHARFSGAVMDREWTGQQLLAGRNTAWNKNDGNVLTAMAPALRSLEVEQVAHEDTLTVLLAAGACPLLTSLRLGFQSIGPTDDDTPRASVVKALAAVGSHLTHLSLRAPLQPHEGPDGPAGMIDEVLSVLPRLVVLEFSEQGESKAVPFATRSVLTRLPQSLRVLRGRGLVSVSTGAVLDMLENPNSIPVLEEIDLKWALASNSTTGNGAMVTTSTTSTGEERERERERERVWKERHKARIESACRDMGIRCTVERSDEPLVFKPTSAARV